MNDVLGFDVMSILFDFLGYVAIAIFALLGITALYGLACMGDRR